MSENNSSLIILRTHSSAAQSIFFFPYAGGGVSIYRRWLEWMPKDVNIIGVQLPGREERISDPLLLSIEECTLQIAQGIGQWWNKRNIFFGYSLGAHIAYHTARLIEQRYKRSIDKLMIAAALAPHIDRPKAIYNLPDAEFICEIQKMNGTPIELLHNVEFMEMMLPRLRADYTIYDTIPKISQPYKLQCPVLAFGGKYDDKISMEGIEAWNVVTDKAFNSYSFDGDHFFINSHGSLLFNKVSELLTTDTNESI